LAIAHRLVDLMGGRMSVESEPERGSRFSFTIHFAQVGTSDASGATTASALSGYRILIADDSRASRQVLHEILADSGAQIDEVTNGNNVFSSIRHASEEGRSYQLVLLDMAMPSVDGFEVVRRLQNYRLPLNSILPMLSSDELKGQITRLQQLGIATYLVKPITRKGFLNSVRTIIDEAQSGRAPDADLRPISGLTGATRLLVAEDSSDNRLVIAAYLRREGYQVDFAEDGKQAFEKFTTNPYDLVLMDIQMPVMDGLDTTRAIRRWEFAQDREPTPIIALTAYALEEDVRRALAAGCNLHLSKPLKKPALLRCIGEAVKKAGTSDFARQSHHYSQ
jgi:two-component system, sensor histidine kinase and response regulator